MERQPNTQYILSLSYGKDSLACLEAVKQLDYPLDRIVHAEIWATDTIHADLPPMVEFKLKADEIIRERYDFEVEHYCASRNGEKMTYEKMFYHIPKRKQRERETVQSKDSLINATAIAKNSRYTPCHSAINGLPMRGCLWCNSVLKRAALGISNVARSMVQQLSQSPSFSIAPLHKELRQILCSISELRQTSRNALNGI